MATSNKHWNWLPSLPIANVPVFVWPPRILPALRYLFSSGFLGSVLLFYGALAAITWYWLQPELAACAEFAPGWILQLLARNALLIFVVAGAFHVYFYVLKLQGNERRYEARELQRDSPRYFMRDQVKDNMFWTMISGVPIWTAYEVLLFWAMANDLAPYYLEWRNHPLSFILIFLLIPFFSSLHFHLVHRLLHWGPLFRLAHHVHHRNVVLGPWSGFSMHPIEHLIYMSSVLIHLILPSHPLHIIFHTQWNAIGAAVTHSGYEALTFRGKPILYLTSFHHQIHHRLLNCNYGNPLVAADQWFGCDNNGATIKPPAAKVQSATVDNNER